MKINSNELITAIRNGVNLLNLQSTNEREHNLRLRSIEDKLEIIGLVNDSHYFSYTIPILEKSSEIDCYIKGDRLLKLIGLINKKTDINLEIKNNCLVLNHIRYGEAKESLFYNQEAFEGITFELDNYISLNNNCIYYLSSYITNLSTPNILLKTSPNEISVYGYYSEGGIIKYSLFSELNLKEELKYYFKSNILKNISYLGEEVNLAYNKKLLSLKLNSLLGYLVIKTTGVKNDEFEIIDTIETLPSLGSININYLDLVEIIQWQSYNYGLGECFNIYAANNLLYIENKVTKNCKSIECGEGKLEKISVSILSLLNLLKVFNTKEEIIISQYELNYGELSIKVLMFKCLIKIKDNQTLIKKAVLYEQLNYE